MPIGFTPTWVAKRETFQRRWLLVDAAGKPLGRLASSLAQILQGKHRPTYTPHVDTGDFVVVVNAEKVRLTGKKLQSQKYVKYTGYWSGLKEISAEALLQKHPERLLEYAVKRMLPKSKMGKAMLTKLKIYKGGSHPHAAQNPAPYAVPIKGQG